MTKRHFVAFARRISEDLTNARTRFSPAEYRRTWDACTYAASTFADIAREDNGRFDRDRFMDACGLTADRNPTL